MSNLDVALKPEQENANTITNKSPNTESPNKSNKKPHPIFNPLFVMLLVFGLPYVFAWYFMNEESPAIFESPNNQGQLVSPMIPMGSYELTTKNGNTLTSKSLAGQWLIITLTDKCELSCQQTIFTMRQARKSTGINRKVITPIMIETTPGAVDAFDADLASAFPKLQVIQADQAFTDKLKSAHANLENSIYMIDPYGNLMMVYPAGSEQTGLMDDLSRLLKVNKPKL